MPRAVAFVDDANSSSARAERREAARRPAVSMQERWSRFWSDREARRRASLIAAGRAAVERYTPCAQRREVPGAGIPVVATPDPSFELRKDRSA